MILIVQQWNSIDILAYYVKLIKIGKQGINVLENYQIIKVLKTMNDKSIFLVKDKMTQHYYIEKIVKESIIYDELSSLNIAIPKIYKTDHLDNQTIVLEEYIESMTLMQYTKNQILDYHEIHDIMNQLFAIVGTLHQMNPPIIHRDIKPDNIFYDGKKVILFDFDIARH